MPESYLNFFKIAFCLLLNGEHSWKNKRSSEFFATKENITTILTLMSFKINYFSFYNLFIGVQFNKICILHLWYCDSTSDHKLYLKRVYYILIFYEVLSNYLRIQSFQIREYDCLEVVILDESNLLICFDTI